MPTARWLVVGLGNPGPEYAATRHNLGRMVAEEFAARLGVSFGRHRRAHADIASGKLEQAKVTVLVPRSYMNESGGPVASAMRYEQLEPKEVVVVHDDIDIPLGQIRVKLGGGDGGHNGLRSIRKSLGTGEFYRVRVGIDRPPGWQDPAAYVLRPFGAAQRRELPQIIERAAEATELLLTSGLAATQNEVNRR